jgi:hypothetical protein
MDLRISLPRSLPFFSCVTYLHELHPLAVQFDGQFQLRSLLVQHLDQVFSLKETTEASFLKVRLCLRVELAPMKW